MLQKYQQSLEALIFEDGEFREALLFETEFDEETLMDCETGLLYDLICLYEYTCINLDVFSSTASRLVGFLFYLFFTTKALVL